MATAQINAFALSWGTRAKTDRIDAELIARFMLFRPEVGRKLPGETLRVLKAATTRRAQMVGMRKRHFAQIEARRKQHITADLEDMDANIFAMLNAQVRDLEQRTKGGIGQEETAAAKAKLLLSIPGVGRVSATVPIAEMPELGRMTSGEAAAMTGLAPIPHDRGAMRGKRVIAGGRRALRHVLFQAALVAACHNPVLKPVVQAFKIRCKPHKVIIAAIARRLITIANAILRTGVPWQT